MEFKQDVIVDVTLLGLGRLALPVLQGKGSKTGIGILTVASLMLACGIYTLIYLAFFHPLAKYPGPFLAKFTSLYSAYHAWKGDIHLDMHRCHQRYGDYVRYGPNRLLVDTVDGLYDIYGHGAKVQKSKNYTVLAQKAPNTLTIRDKAQHARRRRVVSQAFSESSLRVFEPKVQSRLQRFCDKIRKNMSGEGQWTSPLNISEEFNYLAFDTMTAVSFDTDYDTIGSLGHRYAITALEESNVRLGVLLQEPTFNMFNLDSKLFPAAIAARDQFVGFIRNLLKMRLKQANGGVDIFSFLQKARDPATGKELSLMELSTETALFVIAGSDTTSATMAGLAHYLTGSSACYRQASEEIRSTFSSLDEIRLGPKLNSCTYLRACLDEALRMSPPGGAALWREVEQSGAMISGTFIPGGIEVGVGIYSIHHSPKYYDEPFKYEPERWQRKADRESKPNSRHAYMPFSIGARSCVGKPLALAQVMLTFARLLWEFDIKQAQNEPGWMNEDLNPVEYKFKDHVSARKDDLFVSFLPREPRGI
ncbi:Cytochrome P450 monooxygenase lcsN [Paramyrothecium foliicola]|nr:Cytochrome P450 monooxygenase lcsN [Paramyrothecium foliicola]